MSDLQELVVSAAWEGDDAERGLDRLGVKFDNTTQRFRNGSGQFVAFKTIQQQMAQATLENTNLLGQLTGQMQQTASGARSLGIAITAGITLPIIGALTYITSVGSKSSQTLNQFQGVSRATAQEMELVRKKARELGADLTLPGTSSKDAALAMLELNKGNLSIIESMNAARGTIQLARAAQIQEAEAARISASALNTYSLAGDQAGRVADSLANAANKSTGEITDFAMGMAQAGQVAHSSKISLEETLAVLSVMANSGVRGGDAGTSMKTFLLALRGPSDEARKAMDELGVSAYDLQTKQFKSLPQIIDEFSTALSGLNQESRDAFLDKVFGSDGARVAIALFGQGRQEFEKYVAAMSEAGTAQRVAESNTKGLSGAWDGLMSTIETFATDIFQDLEEPMVQIVQMISGVVSNLNDAWNSMGPGVKAGIAGVLAFVAALGPVITVAATVAGAVIGVVAAVGSWNVAAAIAGAAGTTLVAALAPVALVALKVGLIVAGVAIVLAAASAAIAAAWATNFGGIREKTFAIFEAIKTYASALFAQLTGIWSRIWPTLQSLTQKALIIISAFWKEHGETIVSVVRAYYDIIYSFWSGIIGVFGNAIDLILKLIDGDYRGAFKAAEEIARSFVQAWTGILSGLGRILWAALKAALSIQGQAVVLFFTLGRDLAMAIGQAIVDGIKALPGAVAAALSYMVNNAVSDAAGNFYAGGATLWSWIKAGYDGAQGAAPLTISAQVAGGDLGGSNQPQWSVAWESGSGTGKSLPGLMGGGGGGKGGGGGGGESPIIKAAKSNLKMLEIVQAGQERIYERMMSSEQRFYEQGKRNLESYVATRKAAEKSIFDSAMKAAQAELEVAKLTKDKSERATAISEAQDKIVALNEKYQDALTKIDRDAEDARKEMQRQAWDDKLSLMQEVAQGYQDIYSRMAERGRMTFAAAQQTIANQQLEILLAQEGHIKKQMEGLAPGAALLKALEGQLLVIQQRIQNFRDGMAMDATEANQKDYSRERDHALRMSDIWNAITDMQMESERDRLRILEAAGVSKSEIWKRQAKLEIEQEKLATARRVRELEAQRDYVQKFEENEQRKAEIIKGLNAQIAAEEERLTQKRNNILEDYYKKQEERLKGIVDKGIGILNKALNRYKEEGWGGLFKSIGEDFRDLLLQMTMDLLKSQLLSVLRNIWNIPAPGSTQGAQGAGQSGFNFLDIFRRLFNLGGANPGVQTGGSDPVGAIDAAGDHMSHAIHAAGQESRTGVEAAGKTQAASLTSVGQSIVSGLLTIGSIIATSNTRGSFWSGLFAAAAVGAINGAFNAFAGGASGGGEGGGGGTHTGGIHRAMGGPVWGAGTSTSDSIYAMLSNGEFVFRASSVSSLGLGVLDYMNETGRMPHMADGGFAGSYVPPSTVSGSSSQYSVTNTNLYLTQEIHTDQPEQFYKSARQLARSAMGALQTEQGKN